MTRWIEVNGTSLRYELGSSGEKTLVLVHEAGGALESWDAAVALLAPNYRVLRYDQRGFGMSEHAHQLSLGQMVDDLLGLVAGLQLDGPVHLVGTAIGGTIVLECAARQPASVASVIATSPVIGGLPAGAAPFLEQRARTVEQQGMRAVVDASLETSYPPKFRSADGVFDNYRARFLANDPYSFAELTKTYLTVDLSDAWAKIRCPVLIVGGSDDPIVPHDQYRAAAAAMDAGRYVEIQAGHFAAIQAPGSFVDIAREFLEELYD